MTEAAAPIGGAGRTLRTLACIVVVAAGLKAAESVLLPIVAAGFLALVALPAQARLVRWGLPKGLAVGLTLLGALLALGAFTSLLATSVNTFTQDLPQMRKEFDTLIGGLVVDLKDWGWESAGEGLQGRFNPGALLDLVTTTAQSLLDLLSSFVVILLLTIFALVEADDFAPKLRFALGKPDADLSLYVRMARGVSTYAFWKTVMNALTGAMVALLCVLIGLQSTPVLGWMLP